jgi:hypothetical protein
MAFNGIALGAAAAGTVLLYSALFHKSVLSSIQQVIEGRSPSGASISTAGDASSGVIVNPDVTDLINPGGTQPSALPDDSVVYTQAQLESLWVMAGGSQATKTNAGCHGMQESSGNPLATSSNPDGGINVGLWQLDTKGKGAGYTVAELQVPITNARITVAKTNGGTNWSAWATPGC